MSLILLINGLLNIVMSGLFFFYTNKYRYLFTQNKLIVFSSFSLYFLFVGFLRVRVALELNQWIGELSYNPLLIFNFADIITSIIFVIFLYQGIRFKGKITDYDSKNNTK